MIVDAHNDLLLELVVRAEEDNPFGSAWLPQLRAGKVSVQVCPVYAADSPETARDVVGAQIDAFRRALDENAGNVVQITSAAELD
ncbi:MAG: membrane dipeptidase, partial [Actinomycetota bacterium]|nr:membrane dipeptidase [Actinomycetota bacterium]